MHGFAVLLTWKTLTLMMVGLVLGIFVGVLPGLGGPNGVAILLPLTFTMDPTSAIVMLSCIYLGRCSAAPSPRSCSIFRAKRGRWRPPSTAIQWRGRAGQGRAAEALTAAFTSSFIGSLAAVLLIAFLAPMISSFALKFGPPEFFSVNLLTFCSFVGLGHVSAARFDGVVLSRSSSLHTLGAVELSSRIPIAHHSHIPDLRRCAADR